MILSITFHVVVQNIFDDVECEWESTKIMKLNRRLRHYSVKIALIW